MEASDPRSNHRTGKYVFVPDPLRLLTCTYILWQVWRIYCDHGHVDGFKRYKLGVENKSSIFGGNSRRRWHGTARVCTVGDSQGQAALCNNALCSLCSIIRVSFILSPFAKYVSG